MDKNIEFKIILALSAILVGVPIAFGSLYAGEMRGDFNKEPQVAEVSLKDADSFCASLGGYLYSYNASDSSSFRTVIMACQLKPKEANE